MKINFKVKTNKQIENAIDNLSDGFVKIGWYEGQKEENGVLVSENAYMQNHGFYIKHKNGKKTYVPPRPFMQITENVNASKWQSFWKKEYKAVLENRATLLMALNKLGKMVKSDIQDVIISSNGIRPNRPLTLAIKKSKGHALIPLIDTRKMLESINYHSEVKK